MIVEKTGGFTKKVVLLGRRHQEFQGRDHYIWQTIYCKGRKFHWLKFSFFSLPRQFRWLKFSFFFILKIIEKWVYWCLHREMSSSVELNSEQKLSLSRNKVGDSFHTYDRVSLFIHVHTFDALHCPLQPFSQFFTNKRDICSVFSLFDSCMNSSSRPPHTMMPHTSTINMCHGLCKYQNFH